MYSVFTYIKNLFATSPKLKPLEKLQGLEKVDALLYNLVVAEKVPGLSISIIKNGETVLQKGYGFSNLKTKKPVDPQNTKYRIASISKCITGLAFGKMVEEGILNWEDSYYKHVPYYPKKKYNFTLRQLASHTAGIRNYKGKEYGLNKPYSIKESLQIFQNDPLLFKPGKSYLYNSFGFVLLSLAMQEASGVSFEVYVKEKVLKPLGMLHTITPKDIDSFIKTEKEDNFSENYTKTSIGFKKAIPVNNFYKLGGGGYLSTSANIAILGQEVLERKLLKPETYKELLTSQLIEETPIYYGLGFQVSHNKEGKPFVGHLGSSVGAYSNLFIFPEEKLVLSILINCTDPKVQNVLDKLILF